MAQLIATCLGVCAALLAPGPAAAKALASVAVHIDSLVWYVQVAGGPDRPLVAFLPGASGDVEIRRARDVEDEAFLSTGYNSNYVENDAYRDGDTIGDALNLTGQCHGPTGPGCPPPPSPVAEDDFAATPTLAGLTESYVYADQFLEGPAQGFAVARPGGTVAADAEIGARADVALGFASEGEAESDGRYSVQFRTPGGAGLTTYFALTYSLAAIVELDAEELPGSYAQADWQFYVNFVGDATQFFRPADLNQKISLTGPGAPLARSWSGKTIYSATRTLLPNDTYNIEVALFAHAEAIANQPPAPAPAPGTLALLALGALGLGGYRADRTRLRRRR